MAVAIDDAAPFNRCHLHGTMQRQNRARRKLHEMLLKTYMRLLFTTRLQNDYKGIQDRTQASKSVI